MSIRQSAGILVFRETETGQLEVLLAHPGGPFWASKDEGAWTIPKGEYLPDEEPLVAAEREFAEETGLELPNSTRLSLGEIRQLGGKTVVAWAVRGEVDPARATSNTFEMEWPPKSGQIRTFAEIDRVAWFNVDVAKEKLIKAQTTLVDRLVSQLSARGR
jgi:predicted NUDIX family NTP pyrophosphohydrolase